MYPKTMSVPNYKRKILVMDDDQFLQKVIKRMLKELAFEVRCTTNGEETLRIYRSAKECGEAFEAMILDIEIPAGMGGKETMVKLKDLDSKVVAIVSSGDTGNPLIVNYRNYGFRAIIPKPYGIGELSRALQKAHIQHDLSYAAGSKIHANK